MKRVKWVTLIDLVWCLVSLMLHHHSNNIERIKLLSLQPTLGLQGTRLLPEPLDAQLAEGPLVVDPKCSMKEDQ